MRKKFTIDPIGRGLSIAVSIFLLMMAYAGYAAIRHGLRERTEEAALAREGVKTPGTVIDHMTGRMRNSSTTYYHPVVTYRVGSRGYRRGTHLGYLLGSQPAVGSTLEVVYLPRDPSIARVVIDDDGRWSSDVMLGVALILIAIALAFAGLRSGILFGDRTVTIYDPSARQHRRNASRSG